jgi:hypothetical protein
MARSVQSSISNVRRSCDSGDGVLLLDHAPERLASGGDVVGEGVHLTLGVRGKRAGGLRGRPLGQGTGTAIGAVAALTVATATSPAIAVWWAAGGCVVAGIVAAAASARQDRNVDCGRGFGGEVLVDDGSTTLVALVQAVLLLALPGIALWAWVHESSHRRIPVVVPATGAAPLVGGEATGS